MRRVAFDQIQACESATVLFPLQAAVIAFHRHSLASKQRTLDFRTSPSGASHCTHLKSRLPGKSPRSEELWRSLFSDPSEWWDHRLEKGNVRYPDFKHRKSEAALWMDAKTTPDWVKAEISTLMEGAVPQSVFFWNIKLSRYVREGEDEKVLELFQKMLEKGAPLNKYTFIPALKACKTLAALAEGRHIHSCILKCGCNVDVFLGSCLIDMYSRCGSIRDAVRVLNSMGARDAACWNTVIGGCVKAGEAEMALQLSQQMQGEGLEADRVTYIGVLNACASLGHLEGGRYVHGLISQSRFIDDIVLCNSIINMYTKCNSLDDASLLFHKMPKGDVVTWSTIIGGYANCGQGEKALNAFDQMLRHHVAPDRVTFLAVLNACASIGDLAKAKSAHAALLRSGLRLDDAVGSCLIHMYCECNNPSDALEVFDKIPKHNVVAWNAIINGLIKCGEARTGLILYKQLRRRELKPDKITFMGALDACANLSTLQEGREIHAQIRQIGLEVDMVVGNCLMDMYFRCGSVEDACMVFENMPSPDVVSWTSMISGHVKCGQAAKALYFFHQMLERRVEANVVTFISALHACSRLAALQEGRSIHEQIRQKKLSEASLWNCLMDMYCKCGSIADAQKAFTHMPMRDKISWTTMLGGYAIHGCGKEALALHEEMCKEGVNLDTVSFMCVLSACSHAGLVDEGQHYFTSMSPVYGVAASVGHFGCIIDLLSRAGHLDEAHSVMKTMPFQPTHVILTMLSSACRIQGNLKIREAYVKEVIELDTNNAGGYILPSDLSTLIRQL